MKTAKNYYQTIFRFSLTLAFLLGASSLAFSQNKWVFEDDGCGAVRWGNKSPYGERSGGAFNLEIKEQTVSAAPKKLSIDAGVNGGIRVKGWERNEIYIKACVQAFGKDETEALARTAAVRIESEGGIVRAVSPITATDGSYSFGVSYDIRVPVNTDLNLKTHNGGINLAGINGSIEFDLHNGGVILDRIAGRVRGQTVNGSLTFNLSGERWEGDGIDARTTNGSVFINFPENYSARIETETRRGNFYVNLPVEKKRENNYEFNLDLGAGGTIIRAVTTNGQVTIKSKTVAAKENKL